MSKRLFTGVFFFVSLVLMAGPSYACPTLKAKIAPPKPKWVYRNQVTGFSGSSSVGSIVECFWSLPGAYDIEYSTVTYKNDCASCRFGTVGTYTVTLTVKDNEGRTDTDTCTVYVVSIGIGIATGESQYVAVNNDDDNDNGVMDLSNDEVTVEHEDTLPYDLRKILLYVQTPKTSDKVVLSVGPIEWQTGMRVWGQRNKGTRLIENQDGQPWVCLPAWSSSEPHDVYLEALHAFPANQMFLSFGYIGIDGSTTPPTERVPDGNPPDPIRFTLLEVDVDIEGVQDDDYSYGPVTEECKPGGFITLNDDDDNKNGIADKDDTGPVTNEDELVKIDLAHPLKCEDQQNLPINGLHPITLKAIAGGEKVKVWGNPTKEGTPITLPVSWTSRVSIPDYLWVEGVQLSSTPRDITLALEYPIGGNTFHDTIRFSVVKVDLDIAGVDDEHEEGVGQVVVLNFDDNAAPRKEVILRKVMPNDWPGNVILSRSDNKVELFESETGGTEINFDGVENKFANSVLPKSLWVEGNIASTYMRDLTLTLEAEGITDCDDTVSFTVLWVNLSTDHTGSVNEDNSAKAEYEKLPVPAPDSSLGYHLYCFSPPDADAWLGRGTEIMGHLTVLDFDPSEFSSDPEALHLKREKVNGNQFWGPTGKENTTPYGGGDDTSEASWRDDTPLSGDPPSAAVIYDVDAPGPMLWGVPVYTILRCRINFGQWAVWKDSGSSELIRCSEKLSWFTRQSYLRTDNVDLGEVDSASYDSVTDNSKNWGINCWVPGVIRYEDSGYREIRRIKNNGDKTITVEDIWLVTPFQGTVFEVIDTSTWQLCTDVPGDNVNCDGTTNISWNLE